MTIFNNVLMSVEKQPIFLWCQFTLSSAGAVSGLTGFGVTSVTKESGAGQFTIVLDEGFYRLISASWSVVAEDGYGSDIGGLEFIDNFTTAELQPAVKAGTGWKIQLMDYAGAAANPNNTCKIMLQLVVRKSSVTAPGE